jgi:hypothetical protein
VIALRFISVSAALCAFPALGGAAAIECPATLPVEQSLAPHAAEGWTAFDTRQGPAYHFFGVTFSDGPPQNRVFLMPAKTVRLKSTHEDVYDFKAAGITDLWILCQYRDTSIGIAKKLEPGIGNCRVTYDAKTGFRSVKSIDCG